MKNSSRTRLGIRHAIHAAIVLSFGVPLTALAQEGAGAVLEEITVTAERREQSLQEVPIAVTAFSGDMVNEGGITRMEDVALRTPNFKMTSFNTAESQLYLRGIGSSLDGPASDPSVAVFIDDVYVGRPSGASTDLYDLERIEILRGPQGTLFGKNVVGGAISYHTARPTREFEGKLGFTVGNYELTVLQGLVSGPLTDSLAGKLAFSKRDRRIEVGYTG